MKLLEMHAFPGSREGTLQFELIPAEDFEGRLSEDWIERLNDELAEVFIEIMNRSTERTPDQEIRFLKVITKLDEEGDIGIESTPGDWLVDMVESLDESKIRLFEKLTETYSNRMLAMLHEYANMVFNLARA